MQGIKGSYETDALVFTFNARFLKVCKKKKKKTVSAKNVLHYGRSVASIYPLHGFMSQNSLKSVPSFTDNDPKLPCP